jgi:hypothetical protein
MKNTKQILFPLLIVLLLTLLWATPAYAIDQEGICDLGGGAWSGADGDNGTCTYAAGSSVAVSTCGSSTATLVETFVAFIEQSSVCTEPSTSGGGLTNSTDGPSEDSLSLDLPGGKNGSVNFGAGTCVQNCAISPNLPLAADHALPEDAIATLYVRIAGGGEGSYVVCFENNSESSSTIYRFIGGEWVALVTGTGNPLCASGSGDGAFYLGS